MITTGEIGQFFQEDIRVGGVLHWEAKIDIANQRKPITRVVCRALWFFGDVDAALLSLHLFSRLGDKLVPMMTGRVEFVNPPESIEDDKLVYYPLEMILYGKD